MSQPLESPSSVSDAPSSPPFSPFQSSADSVTSAGSDLGPRTPIRARRYPAHLSHGSPPRLDHKPNTSQYETMEDLLAAAGYSVTRVFTPETERVQPAQENKADAGGIGTMVAGWFAHILPAKSTSAPETIEDVGANPFLDTRSISRAARSLRTHLMSRALRPHHQTSRAALYCEEQRTVAPPLRHIASAPSLPRVVSGRRRALPAAWREQVVESSVARAAWSGGFIVKQTETQLKPRGWFGTARSMRSESQPPRANLALPQIHRARSAPRSSRVHVPAPAPPVRPSPVVQPSVVLCRSSVQLSKARVLVRQDSEGLSCPVLAPEHIPTDGLPSTPARPVLLKQHSNGFLKRGRPVVPPLEVDDEPDLASIIHAFRPPSAPASPTRRQRSIRSLRALLRDPKFPEVPVVCVASPGTVNAGGPGRAVWMRDE